MYSILITYQEVSESDYPIYDISEEDIPFPVSEAEEEQPVLTQSQFIPPSEMSETPKLPIFSKFPMMKPHEFINLISESEDGVLPGIDQFATFLSFL